MSGPYRVAVIGAGPSGFYAAQALMRQSDVVTVDLFERLPVPYGLVRYGVAPDHPKLKSVTRVYDQIAAHENIRFIGNVELGVDVSLDEFRKHYHAVIVACGTANGKKQDIEGSNLPGAVSAAEFVGWYNGHPDHQHHQFDLDATNAVVIGNGNVALDVARILSRSTDELRTTDITQTALDCLVDSKITDVHVIGRRGPVNVSFGKKELREFQSLDGVQSIVDTTDLKLNDDLQAILDDSSEARANYETLTAFAQEISTAGELSINRRCHFRFYQSAVELQGNDHVERIVLKSNRDNVPDPAPIDCRLVVFSIGYTGQSFDQLPTDTTTGVIANERGRVVASDGTVAGVYVSGWIKRGPTGLIGTNKADSVETVEALLEDLESLHKPESDQDLIQVLAKRGHPTTDFDGWRNIEFEEQRRGRKRGAPAEKFTEIAQMLAQAQIQRPG